MNVICVNVNYTGGFDRLPGLQALTIPRTQRPLTAACSVVTAFTSMSVGCLSLQLSGRAVSFTSNSRSVQINPITKSHARTYILKRKLDIIL